MSPASPPFSLTLLGGCSLAGPTGLLTGRVVQRRRLACLALIASAGRRGAARDKLAGYLWPEHGDEGARHLLSDTLYVLRSALGEGSLFVSGDHVALDCDVVACDVLTFSDALDRADCAAAAAAYGGPFLDGFNVSDAPEFERWVDGERERLGNAHATALEALAWQAEAAGRPVEAVARWRAVAAVRPYDSRTARQLTDALEAAGDRAGAIQQIELHLNLLREELEAEPDPVLLQLAERLRAAPSEERPARPEALPRNPALAAAAPESAATGTGAEGASVEPGGARAVARIPRWRRRVLYVAAAVALLAALGAYSLWARGGRAEVSPGATSRSVAVLPFVDLSGSGENAYLSEGISEAVLDALARLPGVQVPARTSSFRFRDRGSPTEEIGRALHVVYLLEGSVESEGGRVRVRAQLIDARTGYHVWSKQYDREVRGVFEVEDEIAGAVAEALRTTLAADTRRSATPGAADGRRRLRSVPQRAVPLASKCIRQGSPVLPADHHPGPRLRSRVC